MNSQPAKMSTDEKVAQVMVAKMFYYQQSQGKEYAKSSLYTDKSKIKKEIENQTLSWDYLKNVLYFIKQVDLEKLEKNRSLELQVKRLKEQYEASQNVRASEKINMRDTMVKEYELKFKEKYCNESMKKLEEENDRIKQENWEYRTTRHLQEQRRDERTEEELSSRSQQIAELTLQVNTLKKSQSHGHAKKCKKCKCHKKEILKLKSKLLDYESSGDEEEVPSSDHDSS